MPPVCRSCSVSLTTQSFGPNMEKLLSHPTRRLPGQPNHPTQQLLCAGLLHFRGGPLLYFSLEGGFGCYQVGADQYQTRVCLVNRQLAALQAPHCAEAGLSTAEL